MCGIAGFIDPQATRSRSEESLRAMLHLIRHRGPDDEGMYFDPAAGLAFGMRRLSIIDIAGGHQPIWNEDETIGVVFNGEIYNYRDLRNDLIARKHVFLTNSDTEVLVHGYEEYGEELPSKLRGMFAFAIYDRPRRKLFLARDHFGQKPLYYHAAGGRFAFASELKSLLALEWVPTKFDHDAFLDYVSWLSIPAPRTHFKEIWKLPPGSSLTIHFDRPDNAQPRRYWRYTPGEQFDLKEMEPAVEALDAVLDESIRLHLQSDVPVGVLLSGGLDSRAVAAYARGLVKERLCTFTVGFTSGESELPEARQTALDFDAEHEDIVLGPNDFRDSIRDVAWHLDEPVGDPAAFAVMHVCHLAAKKVKVLLGGEGADELFAGYYGRYRGLATEDARAAQLRTVLRLSPLQKQTYPRGRWGRLWARAGRPRQAAWVANRIEGFPGDVRNPLGLTSDQLDRLYLRQGSLAREYCPPRRTPLDEMTALDVGWQLAESLLLKADKMSMAASVELRAPFLDVQVAAVAGRIAPHLKLPPGNGQGKLVLRKCVARRVPEDLERPKKGFPVPVAEWLRGPLRESVAEMIFDPAAASLAVLERARVTEAWQSFLTGDDGLTTAFYALWLYEHWAAVMRKPIASIP